MKQLLKLTFVLTGIILFSLGCDKNIISSDSELSFSSNVSNDLNPEGTINGVEAFPRVLAALDIYLLKPYNSK